MMSNMCAVCLRNKPQSALHPCNKHCNAQCTLQSTVSLSRSLLFLSLFLSLVFESSKEDVTCSTRCNSL